MRCRSSRSVAAVAATAAVVVRSSLRIKAAFGGRVAEDDDDWSGSGSSVLLRRSALPSSQSVCSLAVHTCSLVLRSLSAARPADGNDILKRS